MAAVALRGTTYPVVLPKLKDPRLHLAATITSLQVLGQVAFHFRLSIAQILVSLVTCAVIEVAIAARTQRVLMWPASALLTANGVAFVLRVPGERHGDWWSLRDWWLYAAVAGGSLLSKHVIRVRGEHVFNPSNIGLVVCFLALGRTRAEPLDFWWGPMSWWMGLALAIIVGGGFAILTRLSLLRVALSFWAAFAAGVGILALAGHAMTARWHLGPIEGFQFWWILVTSPEVLVFLFFMITDPKTAPRDPRGRVVYGLTLGALAAFLIGPTTSEFAAKVALLSSLALVCLAILVLRLVPVRVDRRRGALAAALAAAAFAGVAAFANSSAPTTAAPPLPAGALPQISILPSPGVQTQLDRPTAEQIASELVRTRRVTTAGTLRIHLVPGNDQSPPVAVAQLAAATYRLQQDRAGTWHLAGGAPSPSVPLPISRSLGDARLVDVAPSVGLDFEQGSFRFGVSDETKAMMGGGVCWLDYNGDGRLDLFAVNSYASADTDRFAAHGGLPTSRLYENLGRSFRDVTRRTRAGLAVQGDGCVAGDLDGDGRTDLVVTTTSGVDILWNDGGTFRTSVLRGSGWYTGAAVADVNGDGRPDLFVAGYADPNLPVPGSYAGFPTNLTGVRDLLFLNEGGRRFREVGVAAGLEASAFRHGLGAEFMDVNGDGRPDLYVANDEDPNDLYVNVPWPGGAAADPAGLGFRFEERGSASGVADPFAGMGIATTGDRLLVTNSRGEPSAAYRRVGPARFANDRPRVDPALGNAFAGWGAAWVDLLNSGRPALVLATGAIPVTNLKRDAEAVRVLAPARGGGLGDAKSVVATGLRLNGRGLAVADAWNDGGQEVAINTIGGRLALLQPSRPGGHWLDVALSRFSPGAVVTAVLPGGKRLSEEVHAGSSYLSSEDPRVHFGLGTAGRVDRLVVRFPSGAVTRLDGVPADRVVHVLAPEVAPRATPAVRTATLPGCTPATHGRSAARLWNDTAVRVLRLGRASDPVQARDLYDLALAVRQAYLAAAGNADEAVSYAAYRLLLWQAASNQNLAATFGVLERQLRALCYSPAYTGGVGNGIAARAIAATRADGANQQLHFADPGYSPQNQPLVVAQAGSTVHDATFWQPLAQAQISPRGSGSVPAQVQTFVGSQWGSVRTFAGRVGAKPPALGDPSGRRYQDAALAVIRATAGIAAPKPVDASPAALNAGLASHGLEADVNLDLRLNAALNDVAVSVYGAKREYQAPRPISMIRYLAFNHLLPLVAGLTRRAGDTIEVRLRGRWVRGDRWTPPAPTPPSPGYPSAPAAYAAAAARILRHAGAPDGVAQGIELEQDAAAGRAIGAAVAKRVLAKLGR